MQDHDFAAGSNMKNCAISGKYFKTDTCSKSKGSNKNYRWRKLLLDTCWGGFLLLFFIFRQLSQVPEPLSEWMEAVFMVPVVSHRNY